MKTINIFYCWQSDLSPVTNSELIETSILLAIEELNKEQTVYKYLLEKDTANCSGTPDIPNSIFPKILNDTDILISDISITNSGYSGKKSPNPNVLIELGYAAAAINWENIICIFNKSYGNYPDLPFDIRARKPIEYDLSCNTTFGQIESVKVELTKSIKNAIRAIRVIPRKYRLNDLITILTNGRWTSIGTSPKDNKFYGYATLQHISKNSFEFHFASHETGERYQNGDWQGVLTFNENYTFSGKIYWELNNKDNYGIKEIFLTEDKEYYYINIFPINTFGQEFGKEVLRKTK